MSDVNSVVYFEGRQSVELRESPEQVHEAISANTNPHIPLAKVHDAKGNELLLNALNLRVIAGPSERGVYFT